MMSDEEDRRRRIAAARNLFLGGVADRSAALRSPGIGLSFVVKAKESSKRVEIGLISRSKMPGKAPGLQLPLWSKLRLMFEGGGMKEPSHQHTCRPWKERLGRIGDWRAPIG